MRFCKNDTISVLMVLVAFSMIMGTTFSNNAFAQNIGMSLNVNADEGSSVLSLSGRTNSLANDITIVVAAPNGNIVSIDQVTPNSNGKYMLDVQIGNLWKQNGMYTISAQQLDSSVYKLSVQVEIIDGIAMKVFASESSLGSRAALIVSPDKIENSLTFTADAPEGATNIGINGSTKNADSDVTLIVKAPNGNIINVDQITPNQNGDFNTNINVGCTSWKQDGIYTIMVQQGMNSLYKESTEIEIKDCVVVPEFGTLAILVLAVAIISIVAVTARTRLGVIPKF